MPATYHKGYLNLRYILLSLFFLFFLLPSLTALAATPTWQGPYVGAYLGGGLGSNRTYTDAGTVTSTSYFTTSADINAVNNGGSWSDNPSTAIAGIQAGHDWVWKQMVYGIVADYSLLPLSSSKTVNNTYSDSSNEYSLYTAMSTQWLFTLRGRLGYQAMMRWPSLLYITGGAAITQLKVNNNFSDNTSYAGRGGNNTSENQIGWTAGAGIELASFSHASVVIEYLYVHMPSVKAMSSIYNSAGGFGVPIQSANSPFSTTGEFYTSLLKIGLNYRFDE